MRASLCFCFCLTILLVPFSNAKNMGKGKVEFGGEIVEVPCGLAMDSRYQVFDFGEVLPTSEVKRQQFDVKLIDCQLVSKSKPGHVYHKARVTFYGQQSDLNPDEIALQGDAKGISLKLFNNQLEEIKLGSDLHDYGILEGDNTLRFHTELSVDKKKAQAGVFSAALQFVLSYF